MNETNAHAPSSHRLRVVFMGSPAFAVPTLQALARAHEVVLAVTQPDRPAGRGMQVAQPAVKVAATALHIPVQQPERVKNNEELLLTLRSLAPDVLVVVAYGRILPQALLDIPRLGPYNVHASLLPKYRGAAPIQWAVINDEPETGISIMRMEAGLDTGPVLAQARLPISETDTAGSLFAALATLGGELLVRTLPGIADGTASAVAQDDAQATLAPPLEKTDGKLDFTSPARGVSARARGVDPWPGAFALLEGQPLKLFGARVVAAPVVQHGGPGTVLGLSHEGLVVACGEGAVAFAEVQLPGRKRLPAAAVVAGRGVSVGTKLG